MGIIKESNPTPAAYKELIDSMPDLMADGYGKKNDDSRAELYRVYKQFEVCCKWLPQFKRTKGCEFYSYSLKQYIEALEKNEVGTRPLIWNGVLIAAVKFMGIDSKRIADGDMNIFIGLSRKSPIIKGVAV